MIKSSVDSFRSHPALTVFFLSCLVAMGTYNNQTFVKKVELERKFGGLECRFDSLVRHSMEFSVARLESEIFKFERLIDGDKAGDRDLHWLSAQRSDLAAKLRELNRFNKSSEGYCNE